MSPRDCVCNFLIESIIIVNTVTTHTEIVSTLIRLPYSIFVIGLDKLYFMPLAENEDVHMRCLAIDRYIDSNGWSWSLIIEEMAKLETDLNSN